MRLTSMLVCALSLSAVAAQARMPLVLLDQPHSPSSHPLPTPQPPLIDVTVLQVLDGDTIRVDALRNDVRIASIDAPETEKKELKKQGQPFAQAAKKRLNELMGTAPRRAQLRCYEEDRFYRSVCDVLVHGNSVAHQLVQEGLAWANTSGNGRFLRAPELVAIQHQAQQKKIGIWGAKTAPIEPWRWRQECWIDQICAQ